MSVVYLSTKIVEVKRTTTPRYGLCRDGYTLQSGAPTGVMIRLEGEKRWRRLMCWCISNTETLFLRIKKEHFIVRDSDIPARKKKKKS